MKDFIARLSSRKFLVALACIGYGVYINDPALVQWAAGLYLAAEGLADTAGRVTDPSVKKQELELKQAKIETLGVDPDDRLVNKNSFTPGAPDLPMD